MISINKQLTNRQVENLKCDLYLQDLNLMLVCSLRAKHGNDWAAIGTALGRSASSVKDKCRLMKDNCNSGGVGSQSLFVCVCVCVCMRACV